MPQPSWLARDVAIVRPFETARAIFARAERFDLDRGGRFDRRSACVLIWSSSAAAAADAEPVGAFYVRWRTPTDELVTIHRLEWDATAGGSEAEVRAALEVLSGGALSG